MPFEEHSRLTPRPCAAGVADEPLPAAPVDGGRQGTQSSAGEPPVSLFIDPREMTCGVVDRGSIFMWILIIFSLLRSPLPRALLLLLHWCCCWQCASSRPSLLPMMVNIWRFYMIQGCLLLAFARGPIDDDTQVVGIHAFNTHPPGEAVSFVTHASQNRSCGAGGGRSRRRPRLLLRRRLAVVMPRRREEDAAGVVGPCVEREVEAVVRHLDWHEVPRVRTTHCQADTLACGEGCGGEGGSAAVP